ncbi:hypothetical protein [Naasia lichenicola]|uniref:Uncharacterized protein n=1 Tax=Naasia lichenicola TaxID=2565933 RepID=A0A4S4FE92_9MICO|nr:hypothetical protein [Naasia lichenicola]THG28450.1 hypothetical protein E6C64_16610 [Naasia lichenicola]
MTIVRVDRDSVAMGDDVESHIVEWEFPDHACGGDVLLRALDEHYLASVAGAVAWSLWLGEFEFGEYRDGSPRLQEVRIHPAALVTVPLSGTPHVQILNSFLLTTPFPTASWADPSGRFGAEFSYHSGGGPIEVGDFRTWLAKDRPRREAITRSAH